MLEDWVLPQTDLQLPQEDPDDPLVLNGLRVMDKQGIATDNDVRRNGIINREDRKQNKPNTRLMDISSKPN